MRDVHHLRGALLVGAISVAAGLASCGSNEDGSESTFAGGGGSGGGDASTGPDGSAGSAGNLFGDGSAGDGATIAIDALSIDPTAATLAVSGSTTKTQQFKALGSVEGGAPFAVPATFTVDDATAGTIDPSSGLYTTTNAAGGVVHVTAAYGGKTAVATLTVVLDQKQDTGTLPTGVEGLFDPSSNTVVTGDPTHTPSLVYPVADTMFPQNVYRVLFQWRSGGQKVFHLHFESPTLHYDVYTDGVQATCTKAGNGGACWESDQTAWTWLAASNAGQSVTLTIQAVDPAKPGTVYEAPSVPIHFSTEPVPGAIYYWSTTAQGTRRGALADPAPQNFFTPAETAGKCVACHTLSRNGKRLAADVGGENLWVVEVSPTTPPPKVFDSYNGKSIASAWATFNPDATRVVSAKGGLLTLRDGDTGAPVGASNGVLSVGQGFFGTQPDWAPDGKHMAFSRATTNKDRGVSGASIAWLSVAGDVFSNPEVVVASSNAKENYGYPSFNPTSDFIALGRGDTASDKDSTGQIVLAPAQPAAPVQQLVRADTLVNDGTVATGIANNMPTWAPTSAGGTQWIAFTSARDYGFVLAPGSALGSGMRQIWIAAIDVSKLGSADPSYPAFRVPFQDLDENCHRPYWAQDALNPGDGGVGDGGSDDSGTSDAGIADASDGGACVGLDGDCSAGSCCATLVCQPSADGGYACEPYLVK